MGTQRKSNIELCRIVAIICVMLFHTTIQSLGNSVSFGILLLSGFTIIGVDVFVMLSGYFTATPKKTTIINLAFVCFFWALIKILCRYFFGADISFRHLFFITSSNWFIPSYIGLLFFSPVLNQFCNSVSKRALWGVVFALLIIEIWFDWLPPYPKISLGTNDGHSVLSFLILYLLARAIRLYGLPNLFKKLSPIIYIGCSVILGLMGFALVRIGYDNHVGWVFADNNPIVILSSVAFLMMFEQMRIQSGFVNHIAKSTLAVLLGHSAIFFLYKNQFKFLYDNFSGVELVVCWALSVVIVFCACVVVDQIRLLIYRPLENQLKARIKNNVFFEK